MRSQKIKVDQTKKVTIIEKKEKWLPINQTAKRNLKIKQLEQRKLLRRGKLERSKNRVMPINKAIKTSIRVHLFAMKQYLQGLWNVQSSIRVY
jgi:hypothetical protein